MKTLMPIEEKFINFDENSLLSITDKGRFARGKALFKAGEVSEVTIKAHRLTAYVRGSNNYKVNLFFTDKHLQGECECTDSENFEFCKHCVATTLYMINDLATQTSDQVIVKKGNELEQLTLYLSKQNNAWLINNLLDFITDDKTLKQRWILTAQKSLGIVDIKMLKKNINKALPIRNIYDYYKVRQYFINAETIFVEIEDSAKSLTPAEQLTLAELGITRLYKVLEKIDDSHGYRYGVSEPIENMWLSALSKWQETPEKVSIHLINFLANNQSSELPNLQSFVTKNLVSEQVSDAILAWAKQQWQTLDIANLAGSNHYSKRNKALEIRDLLLLQAENKQDIDTKISLLEKLSVHDRDDEYLFDCYLLKKNYPKARLLLEAKLNKPFEKINYLTRWLQIFSGEKKPKQAEALLIENFAKTPNIKILKLLQKHTIIPKSNKQWFEYCKNIMLAKITIKKNKEEDEYHTNLAHYNANKDQFGYNPKPKRYHIDTENDWMTICLHLEQNKYAFDYAMDNILYIEILVNITQAYEETAKFHQVMSLYNRICHFYVKQANNQSYKIAVSHLVRLQKIANSEQQEQVTYLVNDLLIIFKAKRNFVKYTKDALKLAITKNKP